jgi:hypothetical protein
LILGPNKPVIALIISNRVIGGILPLREIPMAAAISIAVSIIIFQNAIGMSKTRALSRAICPKLHFWSALTRRYPLTRLRVVTLARPRNVSQTNPMIAPSPCVTNEALDGPGTIWTDIMKKIQSTLATRIIALSSA